MSKNIEHVLIVEDEIFVALDMKSVLEDCGAKSVKICAHLNEAVKYAQDEDLDFALLDVNMGSTQTSKPVADILRKRGVPFAFVTGRDPDRIDFLEAGDPVVRKPVSRYGLEQILC